MSETRKAPSPAHAYQEYFGPAIFEPFAEQAVSASPPQPGERILDLACGTGILTRRLAAVAGLTGRVVGVDINPMMIEVADQTRVEHASAIEYYRGDGAMLDLPDASFDAAYCQHGLQFFPDRAAGVREMRRVLDDGGRAVIATWRGLDHHPLYTALADAEEPHLAALGVEITRAELEAPFSLGDPDELRCLLRGAGFKDLTMRSVSIEARFADPDHFVHRMEFAYAAVIPQIADDPEAFTAYLAAIERDTTAIVATHRQGDRIVVPMHASLVIAR